MPKRKSTKRDELFPVMLIFIGLALAGVSFITLRSSVESASVNEAYPVTSVFFRDSDNSVAAKKQKNSTQYFQQFQSVSLPNTVQLTEFPSILDHQGADERIIQRALKRGYVLQRDATVAMVYYQGFPIQSPVRDAFIQMKEAARADGVYLFLASGYRSIQTQRDIFRVRFRDASLEMSGGIYSYDQIAAGEADEVLDWLLGNTSIPGVSRHHSGYAIDIGDAGYSKEFIRFGSSAGFTWISKNDYANAKKFGFIPSYPSSEGHYGPDPEPWEYVRVGN